jgi:superfamily II DNA or RNA helicase
MRLPRLTPASRQPRAHQIAALNAWNDQNRRGILEHATGSGKTFTATLAIAEHLRDGGVALVLVSSRLLLKQWRSELAAYDPTWLILEVGGGARVWRRPGSLKAFSSSPLKATPRIILATYQTARTPEFLTQLRGGPHLLIVADEVHRVGSPGNASILTIASGPRLGLSATPHRTGDPEGTKQIIAYFGNVVQPPFTLRDALQAGTLVPYEYHPHVVTLSESEAQSWRRLTTRLARAMARPSSDVDAINRLALTRARIAKSAQAKIDMAEQILLTDFKPGERWLVYCDNAKQLAEILQRLRSNSIPALEYHTRMHGDKAATMQWFEQFDGVLVSIRCLDEGVDIPNVTHALILASSQNPREFLQRRGRVLRRAPDKHVAIIHDVLVLPPDDETGPSHAALTRAELARATEFASDALNLSAGAALRHHVISRGLALDDSLFGREDKCDEPS